MKLFSVKFDYYESVLIEARSESAARVLAEREYPNARIKEVTIADPRHRGMIKRWWDGRIDPRVPKYFTDDYRWYPGRHWSANIARIIVRYCRRDWRFLLQTALIAASIAIGLAALK